MDDLALANLFHPDMLRLSEPTSSLDLLLNGDITIVLLFRALHDLDLTCLILRVVSLVYLVRLHPQLAELLVR